MSILKREDNFVSLFSFMKDNSSVLFSSNNIHFVQKESIKAKILRLLSAQVKICQILYVNFETSRFLSISPLKWKFLRLSSAQVKICQIPYVSLETTDWFLSKFCISLQFYERHFLCTFFSSNNLYFAQKEPIKMKIFKTFEFSKRQFLMSTLE